MSNPTLPFFIENTEQEESCAMKINSSEVFIQKIEGNGDLNFVLIHNAGGDHRFFTHQIDILKDFGNIILLDLPGHGKSGIISNHQMHDLSAFVTDVCQNLSLKNICLIGLNNGANIVIEMLKHPSLPIKSAVLIDPPLFMDEDFIHEIHHFIQQLDGPQLPDFITSLVDAIFIHTTPDNKHIAHSAFLKAHPESLQKVFRGLIEWDKNSRGILLNIHTPILCILTNEHHCSYQKLIQEAPHIEIGKVIGSKCWATLEVPQQVNAMIERFLKVHTSEK